MSLEKQQNIGGPLSDIWRNAVVGLCEEKNKSFNLPIITVHLYFVARQR
jgi:hypothetical protein